MLSCTFFEKFHSDGQIMYRGCDVIDLSTDLFSELISFGIFKLNYNIIEVTVKDNHEQYSERVIDLDDNTKNQMVDILKQIEAHKGCFTEDLRELILKRICCKFK